MSEHIITDMQSYEAGMRNRDESIHNLIKLLDKRQARIKSLESLVRDVWAAYSMKADESFHPTWEVDVALLDRMKKLGIEVRE